MTSRPKISQDDLREWRKTFKEGHNPQEKQQADFGRRVLRILFPAAPAPDPFEVFVAGEWLWRELGEAGERDDDIREQISFANGQKIAADADADVWGVTLHTMAEWRRGRWDRPGIELADRLFQNQMRELTRRYGPPSASAQKFAARMIARMGALELPDVPGESN